MAIVGMRGNHARDASMDTRYLQFFVQAAKSQSLVKAAKILHISQQGLSAAIIRLEAEVKCKLLVRTSKGITLTKQGEFFLSRAEEVLRILETCERHFCAARSMAPLHVVCAYGVVGVLRDSVIRDFRRLNPWIALSLTEYPDLECEKALLAGEADVGLVTGPFDSAKFDATFLFEHGTTIIAPASHPLAGHGSIKAEQLRDEPIVSLNSNFRMYHRLVERCRAAGFEPNVVHHAAEIASLHKLVAKRYGLGLTVDFILRDMPMTEITALSLDPALDWDVHLVVRRGASISDAASVFIRHIETEYPFGKAETTDAGMR